MWIMKLIALAALLCIAAAAAFVYDAGWNEGRLVARLLGRDRLVAQCTPPLRKVLSGRGFDPTELEVGSPVSIAIASGGFGNGRVLAGPFTFSDGPNGRRIDGTLVCRVHGADVQVDVDTEALPLRAA